MLFGQKLKELREAKGMMQREIGAIIEVDGALISKVENGEKPISRDHLKKLSQFFKVSTKEMETLWLADKIERTIHEEKLGRAALELCYKKSRSND